MADDTDRWLSPEEQIAQVWASLMVLRALPSTPERDLELRDGEAYLVQLQELRARNELQPLLYDARMDA